MHQDVLQRIPLHTNSPRTEFVATVCNQIAHWARLTPDAIAITDGRQSLTYRELHERATLLEKQLKGFAAPIIPVLAERGVDFVVGALATMNRRSAYLPLDPATPLERLIVILHDCGAKLMLTQSAFATKLAPLPVDQIYIDGHSPVPPSVNGHHDPLPEDLAYLIYTSGSTGKPKGVEITHANLASLIAWHREAFRLTPADRISQVAGLGFDAAGWEIWPALAAGASVHFADDNTRRSPQLLRDWLVQERINVAFVPTLMAEQLIQMAWPMQTSLRFLLTGADTLHRRPASNLPFKFINNYGPTECTVVATSGEVSASDIGVPTIGRPIAGAIALVLNEQLKPVADGEIGELCLAGPLVGRGYHKLPQMTAEKFVEWSDGRQTLRIYRTGDQVKQLANGEFAFYGRRDDQVKIRGYRIELGEIVSCLDRCDGVEAAAVIVANSPADPQLVAYLVPSAAAMLDVDAIRSQLSQKLPAYMVPTHFVQLRELPTTANGKLDKLRLPAPELSPKPIVEGGVRQRVGSLVAELLEKKDVAPDANFFMVGGHSMLGVQLVAKIRDLLGVRLSLRQLFKAPTINALSAEVEKAIAQS